MTAEQATRALESLDLVRHVLRRLRADVYVRPDLEEDVRSAGVLGLLRAAERFDPTRVGAWRAFAQKHIRGAMLSWLTEWNGTSHFVGSRRRRVLEPPPNLVPVSEATFVPAAWPDLDAKLTAEELLAAAEPDDREALEQWMAGERLNLPRRAIAAVRARLSIAPRDVVDLGRTFPVERFWRNVPARPARGCWLWAGTTTRQGFGQFSVNEGGRAWTHWLAHRVAWILERGPLPVGARVVQTCGERRCVRPDHLRVSTRRMTAVAAVLAGLLLAGCAPQDDAWGVYGVWRDGQCVAPEYEQRQWLYERDEYVLVAICPSPEPGRVPGIMFMLRDDGFALTRSTVAAVR